MSPAAIRWAGTRALLVELEPLDAVLELHGRLLADRLPGQVDVLAAAGTVLIKFDTRANAVRGRDAVARLDLSGAAGPGRGRPAHPVEIEVVYDGEDLAEVGRLTGLGADGVVAAHTGQLWTAAFGGFAPGFAYLVGEDASLDVPRRGTPRTAVPAGSVALAGTFSAVYPRQSPGGWQLIGRTAATMWDLGREQPALVRPGDTVRYVAARQLVSVSEARVVEHVETPVVEHVEPPVVEPVETVPVETGLDEPDQQSDQLDQRPAGSRHRLEIVSPGLQSLVQDLGRPGYGDLGVSACGAVDQPAARQANRLVGNPAGDAVVETVLGGLEVRARGPLVLALTGAEAPAEIDGPHGHREVPPRAPFALHDGETLFLGTPESGLRSYLAVRGGIDVPEVLGSRSTDTMSGLGPAPLAAGDELPVGAPGPGRVVGSPEPPTAGSAPAAPGATATLRVTPGPRDDWFGPGGVAALTGQAWEATSQSNRIGVRLASDPSGGPLRRVRDGELASEGAVAGSLQVPPSGLPVLFLADHPVTGGYPVIAVVVPEDLPAAAQLAPGTVVRFAVVDPDTLLPVDVPSASPTAPEPPEGSQP
ncbi:MAG: 5-oxoprolinase/urea amidolyase family protein [Arthrobacter sp.]|uniref:5-oxoprolinase subunit B/C family protein n=1 Tax=Arthrobacter sp. TaxID=1667 RepID=UPI00346D6608